MRSSAWTYLVVGLTIAIAAGCGGGSKSSSAPAQNSAPAAIAAASGAVASPSAEPFQVLSSTMYLEASDTLEIDGEVRNNSSQPAGEIILHVKLLDAKGKPIAVASPDTDADRKLTPPGEVSSFDFLAAHGKLLQKQVASYQLTAEGRPAGSQPVQGLTSSAEKVTSTPDGDYALRGQLTNTGTVSIPSPEVLATFYDATGRVVRVSRAVFSEDAFAPGEGDEYNFSFTGGGKLGIVRYVLVPQPGG